MKKNLLLICICFSMLKINAQLSKRPLNIAFGGGFQQYNGDLGKGFTEIKDVTWYGSFNLNLSYTLTKSFDVGVFFSKGDYGYCQTNENKNIEVEEEFKCVGCDDDRVGMGNLSSRLTYGSLALKYKFANSYLLKESCLVKPYVFLAVGYNDIIDRMKQNCVTPGKYLSYNGGFGLTYNINKKINLNYQMTMGYFASDKLDQMKMGRGNDMFMQNTFLLGFNIW